MRNMKKERQQKTFEIAIAVQIAEHGPTGVPKIAYGMLERRATKLGLILENIAPNLKRRET